MKFETSILTLALLSLVKADCSTDCCYAIQAWKNLDQPTTLNEDEDCCEVLPGVTCDDDKKIIEIEWKGLNISGVLPEELASIQKIESMDLSSNQFSGSIPSSYYSLVFLEKLDLSKNLLSGHIESFKNSAALQVLQLNNNDFEGELPEDSFKDLQELKFVNVGDNKRLNGLFPQPGPQTKLINTGGTNITLCGSAAKVAVPAYFDPSRTCP